jgi:hypothetical protein
MTEEKLSDAEWKVLEYFIVTESKMIELVLQKDNKLTSENRNLFSTYPSSIAKEIHISRPTAGDACKMFSKMSILEVAKHNYTHKRGGKSNFYSLKSDLLTIRKLVKLIIEQLPYSKAQRLLDNYYFTYNLNESLVREVLYEKDVNIYRTFYALDWNINDAQSIINIFARNDRYSDYHEMASNFTQNIEESIGSYEKDNKKNESQYIGQIKDFCDSFYQDLNDPNFDEMQYYFKEYDFYNLSKSRYYTSNYPNMHYAFIDLISPFPLKLPVFNDSISEIEKIEKIKKLNLDIFCYTYYGDAYEKLKSLPRSLILELNTSISQLEEIQIEIVQNLNQNKIAIISRNNLPFNDLIEKLHYYKNKIEANQLQDNTLSLYNIIKKDVDELNELINEQFNSVKQQNIDEFLVDRLNLIESRFKFILEKLDELKNIKEPENQYILNNYSNTLKEHYSVFQYEKLILPILVLIQSSPFALYEFLNGEWDSFELSFFGDQQKTKNSAFLAKLIHIAFIDIISKPSFFEKGIVESISFDSYCPSCINHFETSGINDYEKYVEYRHKILDEYYNELSYNKLRIIEGTSLKIKLKHIYELTLYLSFVATGKNEDPEIYPSLTLNVLPDIEYNLFRMNRIKDMCSFISKLKKTNVPAYDHVRKLFPLEVQNTMLHLDLSCPPSLRLKQEILNEFNLIVLKPELYQKGIFDVFIDSSDDFREVLDDLSKSDLSFKDVIQMVHSDSSSGLLMKLLINNKRLLERMFEDDIEAEIVY